MDVLMVNVAVLAPAAMVVDAGTVASALFDERLTVVVTVGAGVSVTVPVAVWLLLTVLGEMLSVSCGPCSVSVPERVVPLSVAEMATFASGALAMLWI